MIDKSFFIRDTLVDKTVFNSLPLEKQEKIMSLAKEFNSLEYIDARTALGPDQIRRMSQRQKESISNNALKAFEIESQIKQLLKSEDTLKEGQRLERIKFLSGRKAQLDRRINDLETIGFLKKKIEPKRNNATKQSYLEAKEELQKVINELDLLKSYSLGGLLDKIYSFKDLFK